MTSIIIKRGFKNFSVTATGHCEYAEPGKDIVCSAVSILLYTLAENVKPYALRTDPGDFHLAVVDAREADWRALKIITKGLRLLTEDYAENLSLSIVD